MVTPALLTFLNRYSIAYSLAFGTCEKFPKPHLNSVDAARAASSRRACAFRVDRAARLPATFSTCLFLRRSGFLPTKPPPGVTHFLPSVRARGGRTPARKSRVADDTKDSDNSHLLPMCIALVYHCAFDSGDVAATGRIGKRPTLRLFISFGILDVAGGDARLLAAYNFSSR